MPYRRHATPRRAMLSYAMLCPCHSMPHHIEFHRLSCLLPVRGGGLPAHAMHSNDRTVPGPTTMAGSTFIPWGSLRPAHGTGTLALFVAFVAVSSSHPSPVRFHADGTRFPKGR